MFDDSRGFVTRSFLRALLDLEFRVYSADGTDDALKKRLIDWDRVVGHFGLGLLLLRG